MLPHLFRCYCVCLVLLLQRYQPLLELVLEQVLLLQQGQEHVLQQQRHSRVSVKEEHSCFFFKNVRLTLSTLSLSSDFLSRFFIRAERDSITAGEAPMGGGPPVCSEYILNLVSQICGKDDQKSL